MHPAVERTVWAVGARSRGSTAGGRPNSLHRVRITLLAANGYLHDRRARALDAALTAVGHDVTVVASGPERPEAPELVAVPTRRPVGSGLLRSWLRRAQSDGLRGTLLRRSLVRAGIGTKPDLILPTTTAATAAAVAAARAAGVPVLVDPRWEVPPDVSLVERAPSRPDEAASVKGGLEHHTPGWQPSTGRPELGRHAGRRLGLVYRRRSTSPGRYLHEALERAGVEVVHYEDRVAAEDLPGELDGVVIVESPYPAVDVRERPSCPVVFWVHHGEHHLETNVRLADRYGADHVLLAHSWHLAHRFATPVTRFPFGAPVHEVDGSRAWSERSVDVAMVGSHLSGGGPYQRRGELVDRARARLGHERCAFRSGISPQEMLAVYADSRIVLNEGGTRHFPITMRVFEAVAAGALLLTDHCPGLDQLLAEDHRVRIVEPFEDQLVEVLADPASDRRAAAALAHARDHHTYDHRVDELLAIVDATAAGRTPTVLPPADTLAGAVARDAEVQRLVQVGADDVATAHPDREVWTPDELGDRMQPRTIEGVVLRAPSVDGLEEVLDAAWRYVYTEGPAAGIEDYLRRTRELVSVTAHGDVRRFDLHASGYVVRPEEAA